MHKQSSLKDFKEFFWPKTFKSPWRNAKSAIRCFPSNAKAFYQRGVYGVADTDAYGLHDHVTTVMNHGMRALLNSHLNVPKNPDGMEFDQWCDIMQEIWQGFIAARSLGNLEYRHEMTCVHCGDIVTPEHYTEPSDDPILMRLKFKYLDWAGIAYCDDSGQPHEPDYEALSKIEAELTEQFHHGMDLMKEYYFSLWH